MTVCIAAICDSGKTIVAAADRMFTVPGVVEFETAEGKIEPIAEACVVLAAGHSPNATEVITTVLERLQGNRNPSRKKLSEVVKQAYCTVRAEQAEIQVVLPALGADFIKWRDRTPLPTYLEKQEKVYGQLIMMQAQQFNLLVDLIVAGVDDKGGFVSQISNPGVLLPLQKLGYATAGTGALHAMIYLSLCGQTAQRKVPETIADVYIAKRTAEVAPGVGRETDMAVIDAKRGIWHCATPIIQELEKVYGSYGAKKLPDLTNLAKVYDEQSSLATS
jgi:20S proteasome alpha/beta subunit